MVAPAAGVQAAHEAAAALRGSGAVPGQRGNYMHSDIKNFDCSPVADRLEFVFRAAGLVDLAKAVRNGTATCPDIERVLIELLLHRRIPYLPFVPVPELDLDLFHTGTNVPKGDKTRLREFVEVLPTDVVFHHVVSHSGDKDSAPGLIVNVLTESIIGQLSADFTLIPTPRFVDVTRLLLAEE